MRRISPRDLRPGMQILVRSGAFPKYLTVKNVESCPAHRKGAGKTHVNDTNCYDNIAHILVK